jgi:hypothetical protein
MLKFEDLGALGCQLPRGAWAASHAYVPTPLVLGDRLRVFVSHWDADTIGRVGFIDLDRVNPRKSLGSAQRPVLDIGRDGDFDAHGVTPLTAVSLPDGVLRLYYCGWRRVPDPAVRYTLFMGAAESRDEGESFVRVSREPLLGPGAPDVAVRAGGLFRHRDDGSWDAFYCEHRGTVFIEGKAVPTYDIVHVRSADGLQWPDAGQVVKAASLPDIIGYSRPAHWRVGTDHGLITAVRHGDGRYRTMTGFRLDDGVHPIAVGAPVLEVRATDLVDGTTEMSFPALVPDGDGWWVLYNGDDFGRTGLRLARLTPT